MVSTWNNAFEIGIETIDAQHKELFRMLRDLEQMVLTKCSQYEYNDFVKLICEVRDYSTYHFYEEEKIMEVTEFLELDNHRKQHIAFKEEINKINYIQLEKEPLPIINELKSYIELWIMQHMLLEDTKLRTYTHKLTKN
ncbi:hemerythrin family protein [Niameybacter massiliensis]|uniref:Hemerythrin family protein n=1 Tax=Holtiella tumoricola TaxID=3018743 RepID=A0AA42DKJ9_9FIRM|nr:MULTISPECIES: hemerythrin family protein [Lachnospirales]MDA3730687.1 hemerythrin family protein [Holtiella tumoricola]